MKLFLLVSAGLLIGSLSAKGQTQSYSFSSFTEPYVKLQQTGGRLPGIIIGKGSNINTAWNNFGSSVESDFKLKFFKDTIGINELTITNFKLSQSYDTVENSNASVIFSLLDASNFHICDKNYDKSKTLSEQGPAVSSVNYLRVGDEPDNRILKIEYDNFRFGESRNIDSMFVQIWFYEKDNSIEFRYGPSFISTPLAELDADGYLIGLTDHDNKAGNNREGLYLKGDVDAPEMYRHDAQNPGPPFVLTQFPKNGVVYRFTPQKTTGIFSNSNTNEIFSIYPNPAKDAVTVQLPDVDDAEVAIYDLSGRKILQQQLVEASTNLSLPTQAPGMYTVVVSTGKRQSMQKLLIF